MRLDAPVNSRFCSHVYTGLAYMFALHCFQMIVTQMTLEQRARYIKSSGDFDQVVVVYPWKNAVHRYSKLL